MSKRR